MISSSYLSMKIQITSGKITENLEFKSLLHKVKTFFIFFLFIFKFFKQKWISKMKHIESLCFYWYLVKQYIQKWIKTKICSFLWTIWKWNEKRTKKFLTFWSGDLNSRFSVIVLPMIWSFMESDESEIKLKQAFKWYMILKQQTMPCALFF